MHLGRTGRFLMLGVAILLVIGATALVTLARSEGLHALGVGIFIGAALLYAAVRIAMLRDRLP